MSTLALVWDLIAIDNASPAFRKVGAEAETAGGAVGRLAAGLGAAALGAALAYSVKKASDFQAQMVQIKNLTGEAGASVYAMKDQVLGLAGKVAQSPTELATSLYHMASIGLKGKAAFNALQIAAEGAAIGHADLEATTNSLTSTIASGIDKGATYSQTMGKLLSIVGEGDMSMNDLNDAMSNGLLPTMAAYGVNLDQTGAALATFGDVNIRGAQAATMLRMAVQSFFKVAQGGDALLGKIGLSQEKLIKDIQNGGLTQALDDLHSHMTAAGMTTKEFGAFLTQVFTKRSGAGLTILMDQIDRYHQKASAIVKDGDNFQAKWVAVTQTAKFQFKQLEDSLQAVSVKAGTALLPVLGGIASWIATTGIPKAEAFAAGLGKAFHSNAATGIAAGAKKVFGHIETQVGRIAKKVGDLWTSVANSGVAKDAQAIITNFADGISGAIQSLGDWGTYALAIIGGIGDVALPVLGGILSVAGELARAFGALPAPIRDVALALAGLAVFSRTNLLAGVLGTRAVAGGAAGSGLRGLIPAVAGRVGSAARATGDAASSYGSTFGTAWARSQQNSELFAGGPGMLGRIGSGVGSGVGTLSRTLSTGAAALTGFARTAGSVASGGISTLRTALFGTSQQALLWGGAMDGARVKTGLFPAVANGARAAMAGIDTAMVGVNRGLSTFASTVSAGADAAVVRFGMMKAATSDYFGQLRDYSTTPAFDSWVPFRTLQAAASDAKMAVSNLATDAFVRVQAGASVVGGSLRTLGTTISTGLRTAATTAGTALASIPRVASTVVTNTGSLLRTGFSTAWGDVKMIGRQAATDFASLGSGLAATAGRVGSSIGTAFSRAGASITGPTGLIAALGGPWGAAITGAILVLPPLISWLSSLSSHTQGVTLDTQNLTQAIDDNNGAIDANIRRNAFKTLTGGTKIDGQSVNLMDQAGAFGLSSYDVTSAALGDPAAVAKVKAAYQAAIDGENKYIATHKAKTDMDRINIAMSKAARDTYQQELDAILGITKATKNQVATSKAQDIATYGQVKSITNLKGVLSQFGLTSDEVWKGNTVTLTSATTAQIQTLKNLGLNVKELPDGKGITVSLADHATSGIAALKAAIAGIPDGKTVVLDAVDKAGQEIAGAFSAFHLIPGHAAGGLVRGAGTGTSDSILRRLSDGEFVVNARDTAANLPLLRKINAGLPAFPRGGVSRLSVSAGSGGQQQPIVLQLDGDATTALLDGRIVHFATAQANRGRY